MQDLKKITKEQIIYQNKISKIVFGELVTNRQDSLASIALQSNDVKNVIETYQQKLKNELTEEFIEDSEWLDELDDIDTIEFIEDIIHYSIKHSFLSFNEENKLEKVFLPKAYGWFFGEDLMTANKAFIPVVQSLSKTIEELYETANLNNKNMLSFEIESMSESDLFNEYEFYDYLELEISK